MCGFNPLRRHHPNQRLALTWFQASCPHAAKLFRRKQRGIFGSLEVTPLSHANLHCVHIPVSTVVHASTLARSVSLMVPLGPQPGHVVNGEVVHPSMFTVGGSSVEYFAQEPMGKPQSLRRFSGRSRAPSHRCRHRPGLAAYPDPRADAPSRTG